jgi:hypothetical protein
MRVLIRDEKTGKYLGQDGVWVADAKEGIGFPTLQAAGKKAREQQDCEVVLSYENPPCELALDPVYCI